MRDATSLPNRAPIVSYVLLKMCEAAHCRGGTRFLWDLPILAFYLWLLPPISQVVDSKHLSWSFGCLEAAQNTQSNAIVIPPNCQHDLFWCNSASCWVVKCNFCNEDDEWWDSRRILFLRWTNKTYNTKVELVTALKE